MVKYYNDKGYNILSNKFNIIKIEDLSQSSHALIEVKCDMCEKIKHMPYREYFECLKSYNIYYCKPCSHVKEKNTCLERYGVKFPLKDDIKVKEKSDNTMLERYGVKNIFELKSTQDKIRQTNLEKYGFEYTAFNIQIQEKTKQTCLKKYGTEYPLQNKEIIEKSKKSCIERYGVDNILKCKDIQQKIKNTLVSKGLIISTTDFELYKNDVRRITRMNSEELFNNWNGLDYYTDECIKENFSLNSNSKNYPTIDHRFSIVYGFNNKIDANIIGSIDNLCITTRSNNSKKSSKIEKDFKN